MRMNLHTLSKLGFLITFGVFFGLFLISVVIGIVGPAPWESEPKPQIMPADGTWITNLTLSKLNQRINIYAAMVNKGGTSDSTTTSITFASTISGQKTGQALSLLTSTSQVRQIACTSGQEFCTASVVANVPYVDYNTYIFNITSPDALFKGFTSVEYYWMCMSSGFTLFELWFRFFFLVTTVAIIIIYAVKLRGFEWKDWAIEQRWVACLLFGLLGYNNPSLPLTILLDGAIWPFLDQVLLVSFLVLLMFFWIIMFDGIRTEPQLQTFKSFYLPKFIMLACFWLAAVIIFSWTELSQIRDPAADVYSQPAYLVFYVIMIVLLIIYLFWLSYVVFRAISSRNAMPYLSLRLKFFGIFTLLVLIVVIVGVLGGQVGPITNNAAQLLSFLSLLNLYVYTLAFVYFPSKEVVGRAKASGMVKLEELDDTNSVELAPTESHSSYPSTNSTTSTASSGPFSSSSQSRPAPSWRSDAPSSSTGAAPIKINFDGLDEEDTAL